MDIGEMDALFKLAGAVRFHALPMPLLGTGPSAFHTVTLCLFAGDTDNAVLRASLEHLREAGFLSAVNATLVLSSPVGYANFFGLPNGLPRTRVFGDRNVWTRGRAMAACAFASPSPHLLVLSLDARLAPNWRPALNATIAAMLDHNGVLARVHEQRPAADSCPGAGRDDSFSSTASGGAADDSCACWVAKAQQQSGAVTALAFPSVRCRFEDASLLLDAQAFARRLAPSTAMASKHGNDLETLMSGNCQWSSRNITVVMPSHPMFTT